MVHICDNVSGKGSSRSSASGGFGGPEGSGDSSSATGSTRRRRTGNLRKGNACQKAGQNAVKHEEIQVGKDNTSGDGEGEAVLEVCVSENSASWYKGGKAWDILERGAGMAYTPRETCI